MSSDLTTRTAVVTIVPGDVSTETIVLFRNKNVVTGEIGYLKICKIAGTGVTIGTPFMFHVDSQAYIVPAGYCILDGTFLVGTEVHCTRCGSDRLSIDQHHRGSTPAGWSP